MSLAPELTPNCPGEKSTITFEGVHIPFFLEPGRGWRIRKRTLHLSVNYSTGIFDRAKAKKKCLDWLKDQKKDNVKITTDTVEELVNAYLNEIPRKASNATASNNIIHLRAICRLVLKRELKSIRVHEIRPVLWSEFMRIKQGGTLDCSTRKPEHVTINTAVRSASSIFKKKLRPAYSRAGFDIAADATEIEWLQELKKPKRAIDETKWLTAWENLPREALWATLGLARFAGLRKEEINGCRGGWLEQRNGRWGVAVHDRPEEGWWCKTGDPRFAVILNAELLHFMKKVNPDDFVVDLDVSRDQWFKGTPQAWLRTYFGSRAHVSMPLHRLRGLYLDEVKASAETRLQEAAIQEAAAAAGHKSTKTTKESYLSQ